MILVVLVTVTAGAGCGSSHKTGGATTGGGAATTAPHTRFAKTKFVLHAGLAFGAFHRYIYKPFREGKLGGGLLKNKLTKLKAAAAAVFAYHEVKLALDDARSSRLLSRLLAPLLALQTKLSSMTRALKHGDTSQVSSASTDVNNISHLSAARGQPIQDQPTPSLGG